MGLLDDLLGKTSAKAAKAAAADTYGKQQNAIAGINAAGDNYASGYNALGQEYRGLSDRFDPWSETGRTANDAVRNLIANPSSVRGLPGYEFGLQEGNRSILAGNNATGNLFSGKTGKALESWGVNYADKTYGDQLARLLGVSQQGLDATGRGAALEGGGIQLQGQGLTGQLGARTSAYNGGMTSAGTIGQGDIAAANARSSGIQNLLNTAAYLGGSALTGGMGSGFGSLSKLIGGGSGGIVLGGAGGPGQFSA